MCTQAIVSVCDLNSLPEYRTDDDDGRCGSGGGGGVNGLEEVGQTNDDLAVNQNTSVSTIVDSETRRRDLILEYTTS